MSQINIDPATLALETSKRFDGVLLTDPEYLTPVACERIDVSADAAFMDDPKDGSGNIKIKLKDATGAVVLTENLTMRGEKTASGGKYFNQLRLEIRQVANAAAEGIISDNPSGIVGRTIIYGVSPDNFGPGAAEIEVQIAGGVDTGRMRSTASYRLLGGIGGGNIARADAPAVTQGTMRITTPFNVTA